MQFDNETELIIWLAGLLEGEGTFIAATSKYTACLSLNMTDHDIIHYVAQLWDVSISRPRKQKNHHRQSYRCMIRGGRAIRWMKAIRKYMGVRRKKQIDRAIVSHRPKGRDQKITRAQAGEILRRYINGETAIELAKEFGISKWMVYAIKKGRRTTG